MHYPAHMSDFFVHVRSARERSPRHWSEASLLAFWQMMQEWGCTCAGEAEGSRGSIVDRRGSSTDQYAAAKGTSFASVTPMPRQKLPNLATPRPYNAM